MDLNSAVRRIMRLTLALTAAGTVIYFALDGWRGAAGFLIGGAAAYLNFHWLKRTVNALSEAVAGSPPRTGVAVILGLRYVLLGIVAYAILNYSEVSLTAFLVGLFAPTAAVILEIVFELIYART
jgi:hypothetical protein